MGRVKYADKYITVPDDLVPAVERLIDFVERDRDIDVQEAFRAIAYLKKYQRNEAAIALVKRGEEKLLALLKTRSANGIWER